MLKFRTDSDYNLTINNKLWKIITEQFNEQTIFYYMKRIVIDPQL